MVFVITSQHARLYWLYLSCKLRITITGAYLAPSPVTLSSSLLQLLIITIPFNLFHNESYAVN